MRDELMHYGILRKSGRYEWGSGKDEYTRSMQFYNVVDGLKAQGIPDTEIAKAVGMTVADLRSTRTIAKEQIVLEQTNRAVALRDKDWSIEAIAENTGMPAPTVRLRLKNSENVKESSLRKTAEIVRKNVDEHEIVDIGKGVELQLGVADTKLKAAVAVLRDEGYETYNLQVKNVGTNHFTNQKVIVQPGVTFGDARRMTDRIHTMGEFSEDDGLTYFGIHPPMTVSSSRVKVEYNSSEDGMIYVRSGVDDLGMGKNNYVQARIAVDDTHYLKGVALLRDDMPPGPDIVFHTNKSPDVGKLGALKPMNAHKDGSIDKDNPFGAIIKRQIVDVDPKTGKERVKSAINIVNEEGDWDKWSNSLPSQMLAKQPHSLIKSQLQLTRDEVQSRLVEIDTITNSVVKRKALEDFADQVDSDAVDLRAASMPRQRSQLIVPVPKMAKNEVYAPNFETGEKVVLIRYPHGGRFEIPEVTVNNNNRTAKKLLGNATDAIGIHPAVAERLSGADFDGDAVVVIPNRAGKIKGASSMGSSAKIYDDGLKNFDPKRKYGGFVETGEDSRGRKVGNFPLMRNTGLEMGMITNLITDMSIQGAKPEHVVRAVKHSMVVIDAEKHKLNYRQSAIDNGINQLRSLYQTTTLPDGTVKTGGASTLLSKATAKERIAERKLRSAKDGGPIDPLTGAKVYVDTGKTRNKFDPKTNTYLEEKEVVGAKPKKLELTDNAFSLVRDPNDPVESLYASHANTMKGIANEARLKASRTVNPKINPRAKEVYRDEVDDLVSQLKTALKQSPLNRRADVIAGATVKARRQDDPTLRTDRDRLKKVERQAKAAARARLGLVQPTVHISDRQWDAIQSGAVSSNRLREILRFADPKRVQELSMPKVNAVMTTSVTSRAKAMLAAGATTADVAAALGISASTLKAAQSRGDLA